VALRAVAGWREDSGHRRAGQRADEPDFGHDINLFSDNPGEAGQRYGFGTQPFGDPRYEFSSQAPFHIGFYHEDAIIFTGAPYLERNFWPEWRAYRFATAWRACLREGPPVLGHRFLGWAMHYIQDMTSPITRAAAERDHRQHAVDGGQVHGGL
jgi:hypothetical protein